MAEWTYTVSEKQKVDKRFYGFVYRLFNMKKKTRLIEIDFKKPWWHLIYKQKWLLLITLFTESLNNIFMTIPALVLEWMLDGAHYNYFAYFLALWAFILFLEFISNYCSTKNYVQSVQSIHYYATQHLLKIDPIYHADGIKGKIIAKIYRGAEGYRELLRGGTYELLSVLIGCITVVVSLLAIDLKLGLLSLTLLALFGIGFSLVFFVSAKILMPICIYTDDKVKTAGTESFSQISLIRSTFTSSEVNDYLKKVNQKRLYVEGTSWRCYDIITFFTKISYSVVFAIVGIYVIMLMKSGAITHTKGIALIVTFFGGTYQLLKVGQFVYQFKDQLERVRDLFAFMGSYGKQTFPVFEKKLEEPVCEQEEISFVAQQLKFKHSGRVPLFNKQTLILKVPAQRDSKLYGIIGFSGQGKSTLLSILGGQLKPQGGTVLINGKNIYEMNDEQRRKYIAIQHQSNSTMRGSVKYNLTFGLPSKPIYSKQELVEILERLGLWELFNRRRGLDTPLSEGGLSLSTGQRQRLNFAALYLRASYYRPRLILIDEPTSHLDEASEKVVVEMMRELAENSLVLIVTHRFKPLEYATGILDLSIQDKDKDFVFLKPQELALQSYYYQQLAQGALAGSSEALKESPLIISDKSAQLDNNQGVIENQ